MVRRQRSRHRRWGLSALTSNDGEAAITRPAARSSRYALMRRRPPDRSMGQPAVPLRQSQRRWTERSSASVVVHEFVPDHDENFWQTPTGSQATGSRPLLIGALRPSSLNTDDKVESHAEFGWLSCSLCPGGKQISSSATRAALLFIPARRLSRRMLDPWSWSSWSWRSSAIGTVHSCR